MGRTNTDATGGADRYRWVFDHSAVSLWEQDISRLRAKINELKGSGVAHLPEYLDAHPEFVEEAIQSIEVIDVNEATLSLFEAGCKEALLGPLNATLDPTAAIPAFKELIIAIAEGKEVLETASTARTLRGRRIDVIIRRSIPREDGALPLMLVNVIDITERKYLERKLEEEMTLLLSLIDNNPDMLFIKDREGRFVMANRAFAALVGADEPAAIMGKTDFDLFPPETAEQHRAADTRVMESRQPLLNNEERFRPASGEDRWFLISVLPITGGDGGVIGIIGISRDITERRQIETRNDLLATLVESVTDAIIGLDADGIIASWNKGAERIYGYTAGEVIGRPFLALFPPELQETIRAMREKIAVGESIENLDIHSGAKDGKPVNVSMTATPIRDANDVIVGTATVSRDISAQKALQAQIIRAQRLESLATLAGGIAHQFNNINTVIKGYLDLLLSEGGLPDAARSYAREMLSSVDRAVDITARLQGLTRAAPTSAERVRLGDLVRSFLPVLVKQFESQDATLNVDLDANPVVTANPALLHFVVTSMLTNALHALLDRPVREVAMRSRTLPGFAMLEVRDTGCGIPPENLPRIFTPFFTTKGEWAAPGSAQVRVKGVGLSLAVCQSTVAEYGGWIEVESEPDAGSRFRVYLPGEPD